MNSIEKIWRGFIKEALTDGEWVIKDDDDHILEIRDNHAFIPNVMSEVMGNQINSLDLFLKSIGNGLFNIGDYPLTDLALRSYVESLDDDDLIHLRNNDNPDKPFIYNYPERLYRVRQSDRNGVVDYFNQVEVMVDRLVNDMGSNRSVANLYMCGLDKDEQHIPCLQLVQALIRNNELSLFVYFRSNDLYSAFPSNMMFLQYLGLKIVDELKSSYPSLVFKGVYYSSSSLHIYKGDFEQAKDVVS